MGIVITGPWVCMWISRGLARLSRRATTLMAARRIAADPYTASHAVIAVALGVFVATPIGVAAAAPQPVRTVLDPGVVAIQVCGRGRGDLRAADVGQRRGGATGAGPDDGRTVRGPGPGDHPDLPRCRPSPAIERPVAALFYPSGFAEPGPNADRPIDSIFVPTDGTLEAEERIRTVVARRCRTR